MEKLYYFSKSKLEYVEVKDVKKKVTTLVATISISLTVLCFGLYFLIHYIFDDSTKIDDLVREKKKMAAEVIRLSKLYKGMNRDMQELIRQNNELRLAVNLPTLSDDEMKLGVGGGTTNKIFNVNLGVADVDVEKLYDYVNRVETQIKFQKQNYLLISNKIRSKQALFESIPAIKPCNGVLNDGFGMRMHPILRKAIFHSGQDIVIQTGSPVYSTGKGTIEFAGQKNGYGNVVIINHGFGYKTVYGHLSSIEVNVNDKVNRGTLIAKSGNSGLSTGPHLHYEVVYNNSPVNPCDYFFDDYTVFQ